MNKKMHRVTQKVPIKMFIHRGRLAMQEGSGSLQTTEGVDPAGARLSQALLLGTMIHIQEEAVSPLH
jgi:hypothetical protein